MIKQNHNHGKILILCSPSAGILDSWLPVIKRINEQYPEIRFSIIFPRKRTVSEIDLSSTLIKILGRSIESVVFRERNLSKWYQCESLQKAKKQVTLSIFERNLKKIGIKNRYARFLIRYVQKIFRKGDEIKFKSRETDLDSYISEFSGLFYDVYEHNKSYNREIISRAKNILKFSISHGLNLIGENSKLRIPESPNEHDKTVVFSFSENEKKLYKEKYGVPLENNFVIGIQRHDPEWIKNYIHLDEEKEKAATLFDDDYIFVISRPDSTDYLPTERAKRSIQIIKNIALNKLNAKIVIKLHPKEIKSGLYEDVLGEDNYGKTWTYSNAHPFTIGSKCMFAVSYYSGVPIDLIAMDVPTIELLDLRGIDKYERLENRKDKNGAPMLYFRYNNLVLGASTQKEFFDQADKILSNRNEVNTWLRKSYERIYKNPEGSIQRTVDIIIRKISNSVMSNC